MGYFQNVCEAKATAQADYTRRILTALDTDALRALIAAGVREGLEMGADRLLMPVPKKFGDHRDYRKAIRATDDTAIAEAVAKVLGEGE